MEFFDEYKVHIYGHSILAGTLTVEWFYVYQYMESFFSVNIKTGFIYVKQMKIIYIFPV